MKKTSLPQTMYAVAIVWDGYVMGEVYGPYNRLQDAKKALDTLERQARKAEYKIIKSDMKWRDA